MKFIHTSDWQIGMNFGFLKEKSRNLMADARLAAINRIAEIANDESRGIDFVLVAGDLFDTPRVSEANIKLVMRNIRKIKKPVYVLAGNHEWNGNEYIYDNPAFLENKESNFVLLEPGIKVIGDDFEIIAAPLQGKQENFDVVTEQLNKLVPSGKTRILAAHGQPDSFISVIEREDKISSAAIKQALESGLIHYVALGDTHSMEIVDGDPRIRYSGAPEPTSFREPSPGYILIVDMKDKFNISVEPLEIATWKLKRIGTPQKFEQLREAEHLTRLKNMVEELDNPSRTAIKIYLDSELDLEQEMLRQELFREWDEDILGGFAVSKRSKSPVVKIDPINEPEPTELTGYMLSAYRELRDSYAADPDHNIAEREALRLLLKYTVIVR